MPNSRRIFRPGNRYLIAYLTFLSAFAPLSTDMYLPALPTMAEALSTTDDLVSDSMSAFFLVYALSTLFWGPLSDRYGRRPVLIAGSAIYIVTSALAAITSSIWVLLAMRGLQAAGCAAASAMSLAIVKDILRGSFMEKIVSFMQAAHILAPMCAPVIGGGLLYFMSWRGVFWALALCGVLALAGALGLRETARTTGSASLGAAFQALWRVLRNCEFLKPFLIFSALTMPFMSFLAVSTFVYQDLFGLSPQAFSLFFAMNAAFSLGAPLAHLYWFSKLNRRAVLAAEILVMALAGALMLGFGARGPWTFALLMAPITFCGSALRPPSTVVMLEANRGDNGAVSALIQCGALLFASASMFAAPLPFWPTPVTAIGAISATVSSLCL
ncbi:MAG: multidrug effflux MFS transporter, partial [Desulfovibrio sp.]|nr:multidrug effflux MFS transporter [Desulfovibrio sp.]